MNKRRSSAGLLNKKNFLGPVPDLEQHVSSDWWKKIFNSNYLKTDADVVADREITENEVNIFLKLLNIDHESKILDLCCGQGRHTLEIYRRNFKNIEGLDRSHFLIQKARNQAKKEHLSVKFTEGDARKLPKKPDTYDAVMILGNSFGYFETIKDDLLVLKEVSRVLKPNGQLIIEVTDGDFLRNNFQPRSWEWLDKKQLVCRERSLSFDKQRLISREIINNVEKGLIVDQFYAERLYSPEELKKLLTEAGFSKVSFHGEITSASKRDQDLGMMARRIVVTATIKKAWTPIKIKPTARTTNVTVILGDPLKADIVKPNATFDEDDFYTIDLLKSALKDLDGYQFNYLNNHDNLIADLVKNKNSIDLVLNLCDEGFNNDPRKELHIPSILETLGIDYTGAGPQCLAFCYDKSLVRGIAKEIKVPVPEAHFIKPEDITFEMPFEFPVIIKPNYGDSSYGITRDSVVYNFDDLIAAINKIRDDFGYDKPILIEEFLPNNDLTVGIIGNPLGSYKILPITEEDYSALPGGLPKICGYEAKWDPQSIYWKSIKTIQTKLNAELEKEIIESCLKLFERLECRDYCRFDWRISKSGQPKLLEVNPNPGWCWDGHLAKMAGFDGLSYKQMLELILESALQRIKGTY